MFLAHEFVYKVALNTYVCSVCGMTVKEIFEEDVQATIEKREPIYLSLHTINVL